MGIISIQNAGFSLQSSPIYWNPLLLGSKIIAFLDPLDLETIVMNDLKVSSLKSKNDPSLIWNSSNVNTSPQINNGYLIFDGVDDFISTSLTIPDQEFTIIILFNLLAGSTAEVGAGIVSFSSNSTANSGVVIQRGGAGTIDPFANSAPANTNKYIASWTTRQNTTETARINGVSVSSSINVTQGQSLENPVFLGVRNLGNIFANCEIGTVLFLNNEITEDDILKCERWIADRYNLVNLLPESHLYKNSPAIALTSVTGLSIPYDAIDDSITWDTVSPNNNASVAPWIVGQLQRLANYNQANPDLDPQLFVSPPRKTFNQTTLGQDVVEYTYEVRVRAIDATPAIPDGDTLWLPTP